MCWHKCLDNLDNLDNLDDGARLATRRQASHFKLGPSADCSRRLEAEVSKLSHARQEAGEVGEELFLARDDTV